MVNKEQGKIDSTKHQVDAIGAEQSISKIAMLLKGESSHWINDNRLIDGHLHGRMNILQDLSAKRI